MAAEQHEEWMEGSRYLNANLLREQINPSETCDRHRRLMTNRFTQQAPMTNLLNLTHTTFSRDWRRRPGGNEP